MTETTVSETAESISFAPGAPSWVDLSSPDVASAKTFYTGLFGWDAMELGEEAGGYVMFALDGKVAAAVGPVQEGGHPAWMIYFSTADADATAAKVNAAGGKTVWAPSDVMDQGRMAVFSDAAGAYFSVWQPAKMPGLGVQDAPGSYGWCELNTRGVPGAAEFYGAVFGWTSKLAETSTAEMPYTEWMLDGQRLGGAVDMADSNMPAEVPPHWLVYFNVTNLAATVARVTELGGSVKLDAHDYPGGKFAIVADPAGATFGLMAPAG